MVTKTLFRKIQKLHDDLELKLMKSTMMIRIW